MAENKQRTVLVVEDSPTQALSLRLMLEAEGLRVLTAVNGRIGVDMAYLHRPDVVVLDLEMPAMNGFEASALISGDYRTDHTPVIIMTSHNDDERNIEKSKMLGAARFIRKGDFSHQLLLEELRSLNILGSKTGTEVP